jgi:hypothetical protein
VRNCANRFPAQIAFPDYERERNRRPPTSEWPTINPYLPAKNAGACFSAHHTEAGCRETAHAVIIEITTLEQLSNRISLTIRLNNLHNLSSLSIHIYITIIIVLILIPSYSYTQRSQTVEQNHQRTFPLSPRSQFVQKAPLEHKSISPFSHASSTTASMSVTSKQSKAKKKPHQR